MSLTELANQIVTEGDAVHPAAKAVESRSFSDRSNCRRAMIKFAADNGKSPAIFQIVKHSDKDFRYREIVGDSDGGVPDFLKIPEAERAEARVLMKPATPSKEDKMTTTKTAAKAKKPATARKAKAAPAATATASARTRYDWNAAEQMAEKGKVPPALDFSAPTHARFRDALTEVVKAAKAGDVKALGAVKINPVSSSPKALDRYRKLCIKAVKAAA